MQSNSMYRYFMREFKATEAGPPQDVRDAFKGYAEGGTHMTAEQLRVFLEECQGGKAEAAEAENVVEQVLRQRAGHVSEGELDGRRAGLSLDDFYFYLFATDLNPPIGDQVHQDMTKPMSHYFIYTGHNSYLKGNQLSSDCSDVPIIRALKRGVRVIELDMWPNNANKEEIHVKHGGTLTTPVDLLTCLKAIKEHAFKSSPYPVIITLEDHLTPELQAKVAKMLTETFGDTIYCPECECLEELPSPEDLKYRVIISTKPPREYLKAKIVQGNDNKSGEDKDSDDDTCDDEPLDLKSTQEDGGTSAIDSSEESDDESCELGVLAYKRLIAIHAGKPKGGLKEALKVDLDKVRRLSLSEQSLEKAVKNHGTDTIRFTQKNILRVYPKGTRFTSSNYKPLIGWMHGAQMVAFNMQGYGKNLWLMHGMFRSNGGCGYVKKPDFLMTAGLHGEVFNPKAQLPPKKILKVKVYMGDGWNLDFSPTHFDSFSPPDFYARVGIAGVPRDTIMQQTKTKNNKWTPIWDQEFVFPLTVPELALLRIEVWEEDLGRKPDFGGQTCLPVSELRQGIRTVPLYDRKGVKYDSVRLLMHFEFVEANEVRK